MALTLSGSTDTGYGVAGDTNGVRVNINGVTKATFDASGNLGIGVTPSAWGAGLYAIQYGDAGAVYQLGSGAGSGSAISHNVFYGGGNYKYLQSDEASMMTQSNGAFTWYTAASGTAGNAITFTTAMTLTSGGVLLVGKTTAGSLAQNGSEFGSTSGNCVFTLPNSTSDTLNVYNTTATAYRFYVTSGGTVYATNTTISAISDARLKENVRDINDGLANILALRPRVFDWKEGKGADKKNVRGFIAQEVEAVRPDLIDEWKDPAPKGEEPYKSVRQDLIPDIVAAIKELAAEVAALKAK